MADVRHLFICPRIAEFKEMLLAGNDRIMWA